MGGFGDWTHMLADHICFNKMDWRDWKGPFGLNDTRAQQGKSLGGPPARFLCRRLVPSDCIEADGSLGEDDYPVKVNVMMWTQSVKGGVICCLSEERQTAGIGLTIIPVKYTRGRFLCQTSFVFKLKSPYPVLSREGTLVSFSHSSLYL